MNGTSSSPMPCGCPGGGTGSCGCGCCEGTEVLTPQSTANRPGLPALQARVGTHGSFLESMKARLHGLALNADPSGSGSDSGPARPLAGLRSRDAGDPAIALLDAWATVADVLTFYQERIANEGYLRTATEMRSLFELSRLVGYQPRPGVAASVYLAYTIDTNTPQEIVIPQGSRAQTVPGQDELPQSFETSHDLRARAGWNRLGLRQTMPQQVSDITALPQGRLVLAGTQTRLTAGDALLISLSDQQAEPAPYRVLSVDADVLADRTTLAIEPWARSLTLNQWLRQVKALIGTTRRPRGTTFTELAKLVDKLTAKAEQERIDPGGMQKLFDKVQALQSGGTSMPDSAHRWLSRLVTLVQAVPIQEAETPNAPGLAIEKKEGEPPLSPDHLRKLIAPPSTPRPTALQLPRSLSTNFAPEADAGLKVLGANAPMLKDSLDQALSGDGNVSASPQIQVWALRQRAGLFGRGFPRRTRTSSVLGSDNERTSVTSITDMGEWPIVLGTTGTETPAPTELVAQLSLDTTQNGIVASAGSARSWVMVDTTAVPEFGPGQVSVRAVTPLLVTSVESVAPKVARAVYGGSGDSTLLDLAENWIEASEEFGEGPETGASAGNLVSDDDIRNNDFHLIRRTAVYAQSELLPLAEMPIMTDLAGGDAGSDPGQTKPPIELDGIYTGLEPGRYAIVSGERTDIPGTKGVFASEPVMITAVVHDVRAAGDQAVPSMNEEEQFEAAATTGKPKPKPLPGDRTHTFLWIDRPLAYRYKRSTVGILGNVVKATHGETRVETLGNGDGAKPLQRFDLKHSPLTHLPAATASGAQDTLSVHVNDVRWHLSDGFVDRTPTDRIYVLQTDDHGRATVQFGNGLEGARLPTGIGNVKAVYRNGIGRPGNVTAGQIRQLASRPLGVKEVVNPLRSSGGADPEGKEQVRRNAPLGVKALDRLVSEPDYADFARTFAGIGKADASLLGDGRRTQLHLTVAGIDDIPIEPDSDLLLQLRRALRDLGDPHLPLTVAPRELRLMILSASIRIEPDRLWEPVVTQVRNALLSAFGFDRRELAQGVSSSEVIAVIQAVPGVAGVDLDTFDAIDTVDKQTGLPLNPRETAKSVRAAVVKGRTLEASAIQSARARPRSGGPGLRAAQLVVLSPDVPETLVLNQLKP